MTIKVIVVESSAWNADDIKQTLVLGEFADESEALTEIWRDLVRKRQHRAYLLFRSHPWLRFGGSRSPSFGEGCTKACPGSTRSPWIRWRKKKHQAV